MEESENVISEYVKIIYYILSIIIIIFTVLLIIVFLNDKKIISGLNSPMNYLKIYPCYFNIFFCFIIIIDNIIRLIPDRLGVIPSKEKDNANIICYIQAFSASLFDKFLLSLITIYSIVNYLSVFYSEFYKNHLKQIYITSIIIGLAFSLSLAIAYITEGVSLKDMVCSVHTRTNLKIISDDIYTFILFAISIFCLVSLIIKLRKLKKKYREQINVIQEKKSSDFLYRFIFDLLINIFTFTYIFLVINKVFPRGTYKDIIYVIICIIVEMFFSFNKLLYQALIRMISCNKCYKYDERQSLNLIQSEFNDNSNINEDENDNEYMNYE